MLGSALLSDNICKTSLSTSPGSNLGFSFSHKNEETENAMQAGFQSRLIGKANNTLLFVSCPEGLSTQTRQQKPFQLSSFTFNKLVSLFSLYHLYSRHITILIKICFKIQIHKFFLSQTVSLVMDSKHPFKFNAHNFPMYNNVFLLSSNKSLNGTAYDECDILA